MSGCISNEEREELCNKMGSNLFSLRAKSNMTQDELACRLGLSRQTISAIENGKRKMMWSTFSVLIMFFAKNNELKQIMFAMGVINSDVEKTLNISAKDD